MTKIWVTDIVRKTFKNAIYYLMVRFSFRNEGCARELACFPTFLFKYLLEICSVARCGCTMWLNVSSVFKT